MPAPFQNTYKSIFSDGARVYRLMPAGFRGRYWGNLLLQVVFALTEVSTVLVLAFFAMSMGNADSVKQSGVLQYVFRVFPAFGAFSADNRNFLICSSLFVFIFIVLRNAVMAYAMHRTSCFAEKLSCHIGRETVRGFTRRDYAWHLTPSSRAVYERLLARGTMATFLTAQLHFYSNVICSLLLFASLSFMEPALTLLVLGVYAVVGLGTYALTRRSIDAAGHVATESAKDENLALGAVTRGIREVLIYRLQRPFVESLSRSMNRAVAPRAFLGIAGAIPTWMLESAGFATITLALYVRVRFWDADLPSIVWACSMLFLTAWRVLPSVGRAMRYLVLMRETRAAAIPVLQLLESFAEVAEEPEPDTAFRFEETLSLQGVSFRYAGSPEDSLKSLDLVLRKGEFLGVVGRSGAGKSTLAGVLCGLLAPTTGKMLVDGEELTPARLAAYRHMLGYVPQTPFLLDGTVAENVALSRWGSPVDREAVLRACRAAAMDFIVSDPGGLDRRVAEVCAGLSGGQVQRLSIARAIFTNPSLIIFDEATSALDHASEAAVKFTLEGLRGRVTCVLIAHGTTSLADCDRIAWLEDGRLRMLGTPAQVLPEYREHMAGPGKVEEPEKTAQ